MPSVLWDVLAPVSRKREDGTSGSENSRQHDLGIRDGVAKPWLRRSVERSSAMIGRAMFPTAHHAQPLIVGFYGDGPALIGEALFDFFNTVPLSGPRTELCRIMTRFKSDKGSGWHNYTLLYDFLFRHRRFEVEHVFELGLGTNFTDVPSNCGPNASPGASLRGWREYFPQAKIFGADIDRRVLFSEDRISTFYVDQLSPEAIGEMWAAIGQEEFDIIIDDGLHLFESSSCFFRHSYGRLRKWGYYIIEDIVITDENLQKYHNHFADLSVSGVIVKIPNAYNNYDNCLGIFRG